MKSTDVTVIGTVLYLLPVETRVPLKFGAETLTEIVCARVCVSVRDRTGKSATGWGETPLNVQWVWPGTLSYAFRQSRLTEFCSRLAQVWASFPVVGHPMEIGADFQRDILPALLDEVNRPYPPESQMPWLAALVCCSAFDLALHDAYGQVHGCATYNTYHAGFMNRSLGDYLTADGDATTDFCGKYPADFLVFPRPARLEAWHLVGGLDALTSDDLTGQEPDDGYPVTLADWIQRDGLTCLKIKLRGNDADWDYERLARVGRIAEAQNVTDLSADFNCTVEEPKYVNGVLDRLLAEEPETYRRLLYVEQPFPYDLERHSIDVHSVSARKPLFMDESAHDWRLVRLGRRLGWNGVALKTCKTQTGALLACCWAKAHGIALMVQDLTNPMLAQIPHALLAAHVGTIRGVETNAMQFYPEASAIEARTHPGLYRRRQGQIDLTTIGGPGFGYRIETMPRSLPPATVVCGEVQFPSRHECPR